MEAQTKPAMNFDADALAWAASHFAFVSSDLLRDSPWARTYRLSQGTKAAYLKVLPQQQKPVLQPTVLLAEYFPGRVPGIIACDNERCWILSVDHGGRMLSYDSPEADQCRILTTYAQLQLEALALPDLLASLRLTDLSSLLARFLQFLQPDDDASTSTHGRVRAQYYIGRSEAKRYFKVLHRGRELLERHLQPAAILPITLCHGDLRPPNMATGPDGDCILCDWDDASAGPAGLSLHGMFSGCFKPTILLSENAEAATAIAGEHRARRLEAYIAKLVNGGYADEATLRSALPAAICAGVLHYLLNFASYPRDSRSYRKAVARSIKSRLSDLLDLCDLLAAREQATAQKFFRHYERTGQLRRAQYLLEGYLTNHRGDGAAYAAMARVLKARGKVDKALATYQHALELAPDRATLYNDLGLMLLQKLELDKAGAQFAQAIEIDPNLTSARNNLARTKSLEQIRCHAQESAAVPTLTYSAKEAANGLPRSEKPAFAASLFKKYGVLQIDNVFPVDMIQHLQDAFFKRYTSYFRKDDHPDALRLGDQRYMLTVDLEDPFSNPALYASPLILPILRQLLGDNCIIGAYTSVISLPGAGTQSLHKDQPALFPSTSLHHRIPSFAIQLIIPLVPLDDMVGTTQVVKGSHTASLKQAKSMATQDPVVPLGSCLLTDYRVGHRGLGNRSDKVRPILTIIYNRPWFRDPVNYSRQPPLRITDNQYEQVPKQHQKLFRWWKEDRSH